jgi:hypothetical protein
LFQQQGLTGVKKGIIESDGGFIVFTVGQKHYRGDHNIVVLGGGFCSSDLLQKIKLPDKGETAPTTSAGQDKGQDTRETRSTRTAADSVPDQLDPSLESAYRRLQEHQRPNRREHHFHLHPPASLRLEL